MKGTLNPTQARLVADVMEALQGVQQNYMEGATLEVTLRDPLMSGIMGRFVEEEGTWLFEY